MSAQRPPQLLPAEAKTSIILAAINATTVDPSDPEWEKRISANARRVALAIDPSTSKVAKMLDDLYSCDKLTGTVVSVGYEAKTTRAIVTVFTNCAPKHTPAGAPPGCETFRTDRTFGDKTSEADQLARRCGELKGHKVLVWKFMEPMADNPGQQVRVIKHVEDFGETRDPLARQLLGMPPVQQRGAQQPQPVMQQAQQAAPQVNWGAPAPQPQPVMQQAPQPQSVDPWANAQNPTPF